MMTLKNKTLGNLTDEEWEALCDGCGICCLEKFEDEDTGEIKTTSISCEYLDIKTCRCMIYEDREWLNSDCIKITSDNITEITSLLYFQPEIIKEYFKKLEK